MIEDPIVEEVRRHRQAIAAKFNYDIDAIADDLGKREKTSGHKVLHPPKRKAGEAAGWLGRWGPTLMRESIP